MKKLILTFTLLLMMTCIIFAKGTGIQNKEKEILNQDIYMKNLVAYELENKIKLHWTLDRTSEVNKILIEVKDSKKTILKDEISKNIRDYVFAAKENEKLFIVMKIEKNDGSFSEEKGISASAKADLIIKDEDKYINIDMNKIKIYFYATFDSKIKLYCGESKENMNLKRTVNSYSSDEGIELGGLKTGKRYYYKIVAEKNGESIESEIVSFVKDDFLEERVKNYWGERSVFYELDMAEEKDGFKNFNDLKNNIKYFRDLDVDVIVLDGILQKDRYGYVVDYYSIQERYGDTAQFEEFMTAADDNGIKVVMEMNLAYGSKESVWFEKAKDENKKSLREYFVTENGLKIEQADMKNHYDDVFVYYSEIGENAPEYNLKNPILRVELKKASEYWMDKGIKGFKIIGRKKDDEIYRNFLKEFYSFVKSRDKEFFILGDREEKADLNMDMIYSFDSYFDDEFNKQIIEDVKDGKNGISDYVIKKRTENVEERKVYSKAIFLTSKARGSYHSELNMLEKKMLAVNIFFTMPGIPFVYCGDEKLEGNENFFKHYQRLIEIRKNNPFIFNGVYLKRESEEGLEVYDIYEDEDRYVKLQVVHNMTGAIKTFKIQPEDYTKGEEILMGKTLENFSFELNPYESIIIKYRK